MGMLYLINFDIAIAESIRDPSFIKLLVSIKDNIRPTYNTNTTSMARRFWIDSEKIVIEYYYTS